MKRLLLVSILVLSAVPVYAVEQAVGTTKPMTEREFLALPENYGLGQRVAAKKYEMYRRSIALAPQPNLDKTRLRSDEIRNRY